MAPKAERLCRYKILFLFLKTCLQQIILFLSELLKYNGTAKEVFNISLDLQVILAIFKEGEEEYEMVQ